MEDRGNRGGEEEKEIELTSNFSSNFSLKSLFFAPTGKRRRGGSLGTSREKKERNHQKKTLRHSPLSVPSDKKKGKKGTSKKEKEERGALNSCIDSCVACCLSRREKKIKRRGGGKGKGATFVHF